MKLFCLLLLPVFAAAQISGRPNDSLRKISDTTRFPKPFHFSSTVNTSLPPAVLIKHCYGWMEFMKDSLKSISIVKDSLHNNIKATNVPATPNITFTIFLETRGSAYTCILQHYLYHTINGKTLPVAKAARIKDYKETTNIERVLILRNHQWVFNSLNDYLAKQE